MKDLLDKITSYNLFNYLFPGAVFAVLLKLVTDYTILGDDIIINAFIVYFTGLVASRFGSLAIEPILKKVSFLQFIDYSAYVAASKKDAKLEVLSEANNTYRTIISTLSLVLLIKGWRLIQSRWLLLSGSDAYALIISLIIIFLLSYRKQTQYVVKRVNANIKTSKK